MTLIDHLLSYKSLSIIGMEKNSGKTTCLNYMLSELEKKDLRVAVTSIGIDGETIDLVTKTTKPEIYLFENMGFATTEHFFKEKKITAEILEISQRTTQQGRLVIAKAKDSGKIVLSGPTTTTWLKQINNQFFDFGFDFVITDGALSRKTSASPIISESMILTTGAVLSPQISEIVRKTKFVYQLTQLEQFEAPLKKELEIIENGIFAIQNENYFDLDISSTLQIKDKEKLFTKGETLYVTGIITNSLLNILRTNNNISKTTLIAKDFTKLFVDKDVLSAYFRAGGQLKLLLKNKLVAICINPTSPQGYKVDSSKLIEMLQKEVSVPVIDVKIMNYEL